MRESIDLFFESDRELASLDFFEALKQCRSIADAEFAKWAEKEKARAANREKRIRVLSRPITAEDIETQSNHLHYVPYAGHVCLMYYTKAKGGYPENTGNLSFIQEANMFGLARINSR
jgi:hypothetical protein